MSFTHGDWVLDEDGQILSGPEPEAFVVDDAEKANWVLGQIAESQAKIIGHQARLAAYTENIGRQMAQEEARIHYFEFKHGAAVVNVARAIMEANGKGKTVTWDEGSVAFRKNHARLKIVDDGAAILFAKDNFIPVKVKESVDSKLVLEKFRGETELPAFIEEVPESETVTICAAGRKIKIGGDDDVSESD